MMLVMPQAWHDQRAILKSLGGLKNDPFEGITIITPKPRTKEEPKEVKSYDTAKVIDEEKALEGEEVLIDVVEEKEPVKAEDSPKKEEVLKEQKTEIQEPVKEEPEAQLKPHSSEEDKITMRDNKFCPAVSISPSKPVKVDVSHLVKSSNNVVDQEDLALMKFKVELGQMRIPFVDIRRVETGLVEVDIPKNNGGIVTLTIDTDCVIYNNRIKIFYVGKINPMDEYRIPGILFDTRTVTSVVNDIPVGPRDYVPKEYLVLNKRLDFRSLKEQNPEKRDSILRKTARVLAELDDDIVKAAAGEPFRFNFTKCKSKDDFILISSSRNAVSNLSEEKLETTKKITVTVSGNNKNITVK